MLGSLVSDLPLQDQYMWSLIAARMGFELGRTNIYGCTVYDPKPISIVDASYEAARLAPQFPPDRPTGPPTNTSWCSYPLMFSCR